MHALFAVTLPALASGVVETPSPRLAGLIVALMLAAVAAGLGRRLLERDHVDDLIRTVIVVVGVCGILALVPVVAVVGNVVENLFNFVAGLLGLGSSNFGFTLIALVMGVIGVWLYYRKGSWSNLLLMTILLSPLFKTDFMVGLVTGYINNVGVPIWNGFVQAFNYLMNLPVS